jgi:hypothetical protein
VIAAALLLGACHDPGDDYQAFLDASASYRGQTAPIASSMLEDLTGDWFVRALLSGGIPLSLRMRFVMDVTAQPIPLDAKIFTATEDLDTDTPLIDIKTTVGPDGRFTLKAEPLVLKKGDVSGLNESVTANIDMDCYTQSASNWCGGATGMVIDPFDLDLAGSTIGALRDTDHTLTAADVPGKCGALDMN